MPRTEAPRYRSRDGRSGGRPGGRKQMGTHRKVCRFCIDRSSVDYKAIPIIRNFVTDRGKILPGRTTGVCSYHQRQLRTALKRARYLALLPFTVG